MYDQNSDVPVLLERSRVLTYGRSFDFPPPGDPNHFTGREQAIADAKSWGRSRQQTMQQQAGRPLSTREKMTGEIRFPQPEEKPRMIQESVADPNYNPWRGRETELRSQVAHHPADKAKLKSRIDFAEQKAREWDTEHAAKQALEYYAESAEVLRVRQHAFYEYELLRDDPNATLGQLAERKALLEMTQQDDLQPEAYWDAIKQFEDEPTS